ncbi:MAG: GAF domain-containing protein [Actinobacteria bacterium]|nr:GAF domain-containing protein [Actinomycetota bacterium]
MAAAEDLLDQLGRVAQALGPAVAPPGSDRLLTALTETARRLFGAAACSLALLSDDEAELVYTTAAGAGAEDVTGLRIPATQGIAGWVVQSGQSVALDSPADDPRFARAVAEGTGHVPREILAVPVVSAERMLGVLTLLDRDAGRPGADQDMTLLQVFADQAAIALESADAFRRMGGVLLQAIATAAAEDTDLAAAAGSLRDRLPRSDRTLAELAEVFALLEQQGDGARDLAVRLVREVAAHTGGRTTRPAR